jgi:hypothetical protein
LLPKDIDKELQKAMHELEDDDSSINSMDKKMPAKQKPVPVKQPRSTLLDTTRKKTNSICKQKKQVLGQLRSQQKMNLALGKNDIKKTLIVPNIACYYQKLFMV